MGAANDYIANMLLDLGNVKDKWVLHAANPFATAFNKAYSAYKDKLKEQEDADKAALERKIALAMLVLSVCGGGLLTAAFGTTVIKNVVVDKAVDAICNRNMDKAFRAANFLASNKTANYIAGKVWEETEGAATGYVGDKFKGAMNPTTGFQSAKTFIQDPFTMDKALENFLLEAKTKFHDAAVEIRDSGKLTEDQKIAEAKKLRESSRFWNHPKATVDNGKLADEIELIFYMQLILESDYLQTYESHPVTYYEGRAKMQGYRTVVTQTDIKDSVRSKSYPTGDIRYRRIGDIVLKRINELHEQVFKYKLVSGSLDLVALANAEHAIDRIGASNVHRLITGA